MADQYHAAAEVIEKARKKKGNLKSLCFQSRFANKRKLYALVCQTVKYKKVITKLLDKLQIKGTDFTINTDLCLVVVYEIIFEKGVHCDGEIGDFAKNYGENLSSGFLQLQESSDDMNMDAVEQVALPRYVRVNTLKASIDEVIDAFKKDGFQFQEALVDGCDQQAFCRDAHIPGVLVFCPGTDLHQHILYRKGLILLQDKASCLPAFLLQPKSGSTVIDACAAPGNKTTHLASVMQNQGKIYAFDLDAKRLKLMEKQIKKAGAENIQAAHQDFLKTYPGDDKFAKVRYILLDPSCSGSGMVSRMDQLLDEDFGDQEKLSKRLDALSKFQYAVLCHALSFPGVRKVSYSTCSIHQQENEDVVERVLNRFGKKFSLVHLLPSWTHRGLPSFSEGPKCLRASPEVDKTNGFFVAIFKRINKVSEADVISAEKELVGHKEKDPTRRQRKRKHPKKTPLTEKEQLTNNLATQKIKHSANSKRRRKLVRNPVTS